ncbi:MAG: iron-containing alcohol dehydrogenase family protein [Spirochaetia bacterium]
MITPFSFVLPTRIVYGAGSLSVLAETLEDEGFSRPLIVTDPTIRSLSWFESLIRGLEGSGKETALFDRVEPNPKDRNVLAGLEKAREWGADCLVAVGGGSPIDCAKAVNGCGLTGEEPAVLKGTALAERLASTGPAGTGFPVIAVPTTAGTGSEVTFSSVVTDTVKKEKLTIKNPAIAPRIAIIDPETTMSMPPALTAAVGMDALTHAVEAYSSRAAEPIADAAALHAVKLIRGSLERAVADGSDRDARDRMMMGSLLAGIAFSHSDVGAVHCIAEALGALYDAPHGTCNAVCLEAVMEYSLPEAAGRYAGLAAAFGVDPFTVAQEAARAAVREVGRMSRAVGLPSLAELGVRRDDLDTIAGLSERNGSNPNHPKTMTSEDYRKLLERLMECPRSWG